MQLTVCRWECLSCNIFSTLPHLRYKSIVSASGCMPRAKKDNEKDSEIQSSFIIPIHSDSFSKLMKAYLSVFPSVRLVSLCPICKLHFSRHCEYWTQKTRRIEGQISDFEKIGIMKARSISNPSWYWAHPHKLIVPEVG